MKKSQKNLLVAAAIAGLAVGAVAKDKVAGNDQIQHPAGKQVTNNFRVLNSCNGCSGKTNSVAAE